MIFRSNRGQRKKVKKLTILDTQKTIWSLFLDPNYILTFFESRKVVKKEAILDELTILGFFCWKPANKLCWSRFWRNYLSETGNGAGNRRFLCGEKSVIKCFLDVFILFEKIWKMLFWKFFCFLFLLCKGKG